MLEYRAEQVLWVLGTVLPFILMGAWITVAGQAEMELSQGQIARYFFATFVVRNLTLVWVVWVFERDLIEGTLSHQLLQPLNPMWRYMAQHVSERLTRVPPILIIGLIFFWVYPPARWIPGWEALAIAPFVIALCFVMRFFVQYCFAMLAFWTERAHAVEQLWALPYMFLSGLVAPLEFYPEALRQILIYTPFPYLMWFPAQVIIGGEVNLLLGIGVMTFWTIAFYLGMRGLWRLGLRQYTAMGA